MPHCGSLIQIIRTPYPAAANCATAAAQRLAQILDENYSRWLEQDGASISKRRALMLKLPKHNRYEYSVIGERSDYSWPGGKRLAFCVTTNIEVYAYRKGTGWDPAKKGEPQQQRNYSWRDYGNRVGIWRLFELFDQLKLPAAHNINSLLYEYHPQICDRIRKRGDEFVGHGRTNAERQGDLWEDVVMLHRERPAGQLRLERGPSERTSSSG
jgi:hypothetical protein